MHVLRDSIAYEWPARSVLFPCRFRPKAKRWNRRVPPWSLVEALCEALPTNRRCPRTSNPDRSARATQDSRYVFFLPFSRVHEYRYRWHTSESPVLAHCGKGCTESGTSGIDHLFRVRAFRLRMEVRVPSPPFARRAIVPGRPDGKFVRENQQRAHL